MNDDRFCLEGRTRLVIDRVIAVQVREVGTDEGQISRAEIADMVSDETLARTLRHQHQLIFRMEMPGGGVVAILEELDHEGLLRVHRQMLQDWPHFSTFMLQITKILAKAC